MSTLPLQPNEDFHRKFVIRGPDGAKVAADALPSVTVYRNGVATAITVTVTQLSPVEYDTQFTVPSNATAADSWQYLIEATVASAGVTQFVQLGQFLFLTDSVQRGFTLRNSRGESQAADVTSPENPTATVIRNNVDESTAVTITADPNSPTQGRYIFSFTIPGAWAVDDELQIRLNATIDGVDVQRLWFLGKIADVGAATINVGALRVEEETLDIAVEDVAVDITVEDVVETINLEEVC